MWQIRARTLFLPLKMQRQSNEALYLTLGINILQGVAYQIESLLHSFYATKVYFFSELCVSLHYEYR